MLPAPGSKDIFARGSHRSLRSARGTVFLPLNGIWASAAAFYLISKQESGFKCRSGTHIQNSIERIDDLVRLEMSEDPDVFSVSRGISVAALC